MLMKIAVPIWEGRVSTTFDFARRALVVDADGTREVGRHEASLPDEAPPRRAGRLRALGVEAVLCGAVSRPLALAVRQAGIELIPFVAGPVDAVLEAYLGGRLADTRFLQPGCVPGARRRWRRRGGCRGGRGDGYV
jgi:predicted Fe-Mo cluster-binding NifX family protein